MAIQFRCKCGYEFSVPVEMAGKRARCSLCKEIVQVPAAPAVMGEDGLEPLDDAPPSRPAAVRQMPARAAQVQSPGPAAGLLDDPLEDSLNSADPLASTASLPPSRRKGKASGGRIDWGDPITLAMAGGGTLFLILAAGFLWVAFRAPVVPPTAVAQTTTPANPAQPAPPAPAPSPVAGIAPSLPAPILPGNSPTNPNPTNPNPTASPNPAPHPLPSFVPPGVSNPPPVNPPPVAPPTNPSGTNTNPPAGNPPQPGPGDPPRSIPPPVVQPQPGVQPPGAQPPGGIHGQSGDGRPQAGPTPIDPNYVNLDVPKSGKLELGQGRRLLCPDENGQMVVGQLHCKVDDVNLILLPSGILTTAHNRAVSPTERPFVPLTRSEVLARLKAGEFRKFKTAETEHYCYLYGCSEGYLQTTQDILESMHDGVNELMKKWELPVVEPTMPLVVVIFGDRIAFNKYDPVPSGVLAYYSQASNFIVMYEDERLADAAPEYAMRQASSTIAHEGVHQLLHNTGIQGRLARWPLWVTEGLAEYLCPIKVTSNMVKKGADSMPSRRLKWNKGGLMNDVRMFELLEIPQTGGKVREIVGQDDLDSAGYAIAWGLTHYLVAKRGDDFRAYLRELVDLQPMEQIAPDFKDRMESLFVKHFGADYSILESTVAKYLNSPEMQRQYKDPLVYQTHYVIVHTAVRGKTAQIMVAITLSPDAARDWRERQEARFPTAKNGFRTEVCATRKDAEILLTRLMSQ